jgi:phosphatidylglycerophosphatase A
LRFKYGISDLVACSLASTLGSGYFPLAPGTVGAALGLAVLWYLPVFTPLQLSGLLALILLTGIWASSRAEKIWGPDPGRVNWDEVAGMVASVLFLPKTWMVYLSAFVLFRIFDIAKPFPVNRAERLPGGLGIMMDDLVAGVYANLIGQIVFRLIVPHV